MVDYLRISVTDLCNLNCIYCRPMEHKKHLKHEDVLRYEEMVQIINYFSQCGIKKIRLTGGEPLIKKNISHLIKKIKLISKIEEVTITTNGLLLPELAQELKDSGLDRVNISIDSLQRDRYKDITGHNRLQTALDGIQAAKDAGFSNIKLNVVLMKNINDDEIIDLIDFASKQNLIIRFIELFETNRNIMDFAQKTVSTETVQKIIKQKYTFLTPINGVIGYGPSNYFTYMNNGKKNTIGFISNNSSNFCNTCTRLRMNSVGKISPCLFSGFTHDLKKIIRANKSKEEIIDFINEIIKHKDNYTKRKNNCGNIEMSSIGG